MPYSGFELLSQWRPVNSSWFRDLHNFSTFELDRVELYITLTRFSNCSGSKKLLIRQPLKKNGNWKLWGNSNISQNRSNSCSGWFWIKKVVLLLSLSTVEKSWLVAAHGWIGFFAVVVIMVELICFSSLIENQNVIIALMSYWDIKIEIYICALPSFLMICYLETKLEF